MKLKGVLDFSLGNFLCLRGFAPMGVLQDISKPDENIQRIPKDERLKEIRDYFKKGEFLFFPEVVLCVSLRDGEDDTEVVAKLYADVKNGKSFKSLKFDRSLILSSVVSKTKKTEDIRSVQFFQTATLQFNDSQEAIFSRIDGNHRLKAPTKEDTVVRERVAPFCIIFCRHNVELRHFSRALFHIINYKQIPLPKEHNLKLILDDPIFFTDDKLKTDPSFGWSYYLARKLYNKLDFDLLVNLKPFLQKEPRSFLVDQFTFLLDKNILKGSEEAVKHLKEALGRVNVLLDTWPMLKDSRNSGLLAALIYYELKASKLITSFVGWVLDNHLHLIEESITPDLISIFDKVLESRKRTIFVSMPFGKAATEKHYMTIERICREVSSKYNLKPRLKVQRVDWFHDGTSYVITDKIFEMISNCGLLLGDLTYCNPNVYNEIGFIMGKAKVEGKQATNMLLFLNESVKNKKDKCVGFNLRSSKQIRFTKTEKFATDLRENIEKFFKLKA